MRIGLLAYSSNTGLGYQTRDFYAQMGAEKVLIADLSSMNGMPVDHSWCKDARIASGYPTKADFAWLLDGIDVIFACENPLSYDLFTMARKAGVKTVLQYNFEFLQYMRRIDLPAPDVFASPSYWEMDRVRNLGIAPVEYLPVPVRTDRIPYRKFNEVKTFVHVAGRVAKNDRNGTLQFLEMAKKLVDTDYEFLMYAQQPKEEGTKEPFHVVMVAFVEAKRILGNRLTLRFDVKDNIDLYAEGEIMILPRKYAGLCLPLWEALAAGMPVIMTNISPNNKVLPPQWLCDTTLKGNAGLLNPINMYEADVDSLLETALSVVDNIVISNKKALAMAKSMSWEARKPYYEELFERVCK